MSVTSRLLEELKRYPPPELKAIRGKENKGKYNEISLAVLKAKIRVLNGNPHKDPANATTGGQNQIKQGYTKQFSAIIGDYGDTKNGPNTIEGILSNNESFAKSAVEANKRYDSSMFNNIYAYGNNNFTEYKTILLGYSMNLTYTLAGQIYSKLVSTELALHVMNNRPKRSIRLSGSRSPSDFKLENILSSIKSKQSSFGSGNLAKYIETMYSGDLYTYNTDESNFDVDGIRDLLVSANPNDQMASNDNYIGGSNWDNTQYNDCKG